MQVSVNVPHILVVDDDQRLRDLLVRYLGMNGFRVSVAQNAAEARLCVREVVFDLIVLDIMMPGESGFELARSLKRKMTMPILMLSAVSGVKDRIMSLENGADDYLTKPFEPKELLVRIQNILRRARRATAPSSVVHFGDFSYDIERQQLLCKERAVALTESERSLLTQLAIHNGNTLSRHDMQHCCGAGARSVDTAIARLRKKIEENRKHPLYLHTVRGRGYVLMGHRSARPPGSG